MNRIYCCVLAFSVISGCSKSPEQPAKAQSTQEQSAQVPPTQVQPSQAQPEPQQNTTLAADDPRNLALAPQPKTLDQQKEARFEIQKRANSLSDSDFQIYKHMVQDSYEPNTPSHTRQLTIERPFTSPSKEMPGMPKALSVWFDALPPSQAMPLKKQLEGASPATELRVLEDAYNKRWGEIVSLKQSNSTFCRLDGQMRKIQFDGSKYEFPVGMFNLGVIENTYILSNGKFLQRTPATLVSDADYKKIEALVNDQENHALRICWKNGNNYFYTPEQKKFKGPDFPSYGVEIAGTFDIVNVNTGQTDFSFPNSWFFY